ncbi:MAG: nuclease A inhibitor family protein [Sporocytophaga sp.]|uniref:nuclease A inhibitor family protein n=1 Tax=Sporocytophaga sp. TaxID=2231183 RepID=UPI001AFFCA56|nr:nuclease A inhibitor family protein [Sporocytophaga sp.]MBO9702135.1 nuclease A inhibitor family protein [Sporocytophaga sp.]
MNPDLLKIKEASAGLYYLSESDYPFEVVQFDDTNHIESSLIELSHLDKSSKVEKVTLEYFFRNMTKVYPESTDDQKMFAAKFIMLQNMLQEELTDIVVYRVGETRIDAFIIGKLKDGTLGGLKTKVVET